MVSFHSEVVFMWTPVRSTFYLKSMLLKIMYRLKAMSGRFKEGWSGSRNLGSYWKGEFKCGCSLCSELVQDFISLLLTRFRCLWFKNLAA